MIVITGGAGFIGSALVWKLNQRSENSILIVDRLGTSDKWRNLVSLRYSDFLDKAEFIDKLERGYFGTSLRAIIHMGACSSTTEKDADYLLDNNYRYTERIARWHEKHPETRFLYASSAATYGDGSQGYVDFDDDRLYQCSPLNMYGYSKHLFDLLAMRLGWLSSSVGLKFFNVFGPNEYHKAEMRSLMAKSFVPLCESGKIKLFKSYHSKYKNGMQCRDFIYIKDAVKMVLFFLDNPQVNGIFNIGSGVVRTWNDVANSMFSALKQKVQIEYIDMPGDLKKKYQYFTCADLSKLREAGCLHQCLSLEDAIEDYVGYYLKTGEYLGR